MKKERQIELFDRITDPVNFFPTFTPSEWVEWLLLGEYEDVGVVYLLCEQHGFERKARICADIMRLWSEPWLQDAKKVIKYRNRLINDD